MSRILNVFVFKAYCVIDIHARLCKDCGIPNLKGGEVGGGGGVKEKTAKTWITKQQNLSLKGYSEWYCVNKGSSSAALLFQGYQKTCFNLARGLGASDKK